jgi:hypothetical protein
MEPQVLHDAEHRRFYCEVDGFECFMTYEILEDGVVDFDHTFTPPDIRGRGFAGAVVAKAFEYAREAGWKVVPGCSYVHSWVLRNPDYFPLLFDKKDGGSYNMRCKIGRE